MAFFLETKPVKQPFLRAPAPVIGLIAMLVVAHVTRILLPAALSEQILNDYALDPMRYSLHVTSSLTDRVLPLFSYMFLHANTMHIAINCVWLLAFGPVVARRFSGLGFIIFFLLCGVAGAICFVALNWGADIGVIGASGAISGLMGAAIRMIHVRHVDLNAMSQPLLPLLSSQVITFSAVWLAINLVTGLAGMGLTGQIENVAWQDHMGGYLAGLLLCGVFDRLLRRTGP